MFKMLSYEKAHAAFACDVLQRSFLRVSGCLENDMWTKTLPVYYPPAGVGLHPFPSAVRVSSDDCVQQAC